MQLASREADLRERKKQRTRQLIAETARRLFKERGFDGVTVDDVARAADVARKTVFNLAACDNEFEKEFARFLDMSIKSASETEYHLLRARDKNALTDANWSRFAQETVEIRRMTYAYRKTIIKEEGLE